MAALTTPQAVPFRIMRTLKAKIAADQVIYAGAKCGFKGGYLYAWGSETELKHPCEAIIEGGRPVPDNKVDNTGGADGAKTVAVDFVKEKTLFFYDNDTVAAVSQTDIGGDCFGIDDHTVSADDDSGVRDRVGTPWIVSTGAMGDRAGVYVEV